MIHGAIVVDELGHGMTDVLPGAYEMVEDRLVTAVDFRDFTFANVVRLLGRRNPGFFAGTQVAKEAAAFLAERAPARAAAE